MLGIFCKIFFNIPVMQCTLNTFLSNSIVVLMVQGLSHTGVRYLHKYIYVEEQFDLMGLYHQFRIAWKEYNSKALGTDTWRLILKVFLNCFLIFIGPFKFLCLGSKTIQIIISILNVLRDCSMCIQNDTGVALFSSEMRRSTAVWSTALCTYDQKNLAPVLVF